MSTEIASCANCYYGAKSDAGVQRAIYELVKHLDDGKMFESTGLKCDSYLYSKG